MGGNGHQKHWTAFLLRLGYRAHMLEGFGDDIWITDGGIVSFFGYDYPTRMAVIRLAGGGLWLWSPVMASPDLLKAVRALGPVEHLVSPNKLHHLFLAEWQDKFPKAKLWGTASTIQRFPEIAFTGTLTDRAPADWEGEIDQFHFTNSPFLDEMAFFHRKSRTAIIADLSQPFSESFLKGHWPGWLQWLARRIGMVEGKGYGPIEIRSTFFHRAEGRTKMLRLIGEEPERVVVAHGEVARSDGAAFLCRAFAWMLGSGRHRLKSQ